MGTLKNLLTAVETSKRSWQDAIGEIQLALNCTANRVTKVSPLELLIGKLARPLGLSVINDIENNIEISQIRASAAQNIKRNAEYEKARFDSNKAKVIKFNVGDYVLLKVEERHQTKLEPKNRGPFQITEVLDNDRYCLKSINNKRTYKYSHENLRKLPNENVPEELDFEKGESSDESEEAVEIGGSYHQQDVERDASGAEEAVEKDGNVCTEIVEKDGNVCTEIVEKDGNVCTEIVERDDSQNTITTNFHTKN